MKKKSTKILDGIVSRQGAKQDERKNREKSEPRINTNEHEFFGLDYRIDKIF